MKKITTMQPILFVYTFEENEITRFSDDGEPSRTADYQCDILLGENSQRGCRNTRYWRHLLEQVDCSHSDATRKKHAQL